MSTIERLSISKSALDQIFAEYERTTCSTFLHEVFAAVLSHARLLKDAILETDRMSKKEKGAIIGLLNSILDKATLSEIGREIPNAIGVVLDVTRALETA